MSQNVIGSPFRCEEADSMQWLGDRGAPLVVCANDPPWSTVRARLRARVVGEVAAWDMDVMHLETVIGGLRESVDAEVLGQSVVVGLGGGTALDTAKFVAWRLGRPLVQVPSITSVDAGFTDAIGVRDEGRVRYIGRIEPELVLLDLPLVRSAPRRFNRAGVGDILSCHTGLFDWRLATDAGHGHPWDAALAALGRTLLDELEAALPHIHAVDDAGVRFLADAYRRIGAACAWAGHSRFEEGSEHFWAYAFEHATGAHPVHGEIIAFATAALAHVQGNDPDRVRRVVEGSGVRAHPADLGVSRHAFDEALLGLAAYSRENGLDIAVADLRPVTPSQAAAAWEFVCSLPEGGES
jgi:glycerol-1-phosphate dehydrogenase [NAD(P)+]